MKKTLIKGIICLLCVSASPSKAQETRPVLELPDISVIGVLEATASNTDKTRTSLDEIELAFQHYLYPNIKADVFLAIHKNEETGASETEIEEGYITFLGLYNQFNIVTGKKLSSFGKTNTLHREQWQWLTRPQIHQSFFGEEGLVGEGTAINTLLPLPFFSQLEIGHWDASTHAHAHEEEHEEEEEAEHAHEAPRFSDQFTTIRLWNAINRWDTEFELGGSLAFGNGPEYEEEKDDITIWGVDTTISKKLSGDKAITLYGEFLERTRDLEDNPEKESTRGAVAYLGYQHNKFWTLGTRYDIAKDAGENEETLEFLSAILTKQLTETSKFRTEYKTNVRTEDYEWRFAFLFGFGPHSHVLN